MINIAVAGAAGRMGQAILIASDEFSEVEVSAAFESDSHPSIGNVSARKSSELKIQPVSEVDFNSVDIIIDFTAPEATIKNLSRTASEKTGYVIGTTGFSKDQISQIQNEARSRRILFAPNMSLGANLIFELARKAASILGETYNPEIIEAHHKHKKDAPSGTAVRLGQAVAEGMGWDYDEAVQHGRHGITGERPVKQIGMHVLRCGEIVGDHTAVFSGTGENIEIRHTAFTREAFANGAIRAAIFLAAQSDGLYDMGDVLGVKS